MSEEKKPSPADNKPGPVVERFPLPPAPLAVSPRVWAERQLWLMGNQVRMPREMVCRLTTLRQVNLYAWLIPLGHPWKWIMDNEHELLDPKFKRKPGQN